MSGGVKTHLLRLVSLRSTSAYLQGTPPFATNMLHPLTPPDTCTATLSHLPLSSSIIQYECVLEASLWPALERWIPPRSTGHPQMLTEALVLIRDLLVKLLFAWELLLLLLHPPCPHSLHRLFLLSTSGCIFLLPRSRFRMLLPSVNAERPGSVCDEL